MSAAFVQFNPKSDYTEQQVTEAQDFLFDQGIIRSDKTLAAALYLLSQQY
ncbi:hypothetical protein UFOVP60_23 [uncultured Caudovirales phage]|uniref:Uncharacterized protein n=1 Tax=uncultured Caudovirales phage TaxID=2100421 RepID=A0A6J5T940_9CAUD|nr:hypothetical protein UFOVP60_23 [uncultured Caudovirales phage]